ncbi:MAG TPA: isochorismatase family protein [Acidimicrobiia bacterium]|nr:isochorismatase family protein [Acidimicrobiia bacterium]
MDLHVADTIPYPWPYDGADGLVPARLALVIAGAQQHWAGAAVTGVLDRIESLASALRERGVLVVFVRHARPARPRRARGDLPALTDRGWDLALTPRDEDLVVDVFACDGFCSDALDLALRSHGRDHLLFAGLASEVLVDSTQRSANDRGYECLTLRDAVGPLQPDTGERVLASVTMSGGIFGAVGSSDAVLAALTCPSGGEQGATAEEALT